MTSPQRNDIENSIIGTLACRHELFDSVELDTDDFGLQSAREVFASMKNLRSESKAWDLLLIRGYLTRESWMYLNNITQGDFLLFVPALLPRYVNELKQIRSETVITEVMAAMGTDNPVAVANEILARTKNMGDSKVIPLRTIITDVMSKLERAAANPDKITGVTSGFQDLDNTTWGFQPQRLYLVAGRPSMGKSAFALNIASNAASRGLKCYIQSLEESSSSVVSRMLSRVTKLANEDLNRGKIGVNDWDTISNGLRYIDKQRIILDETSGLSSLEICRRVRREHSREPIDLLVVDHIQQIREDAQNRHLEISQAATNLKELSKELKIPVIVVCQLSRAVELRSDKHPQMSDLKESGDLEAIADVVMLLYRDGYYDTKSLTPDLMEISISKNRDGKIGCVNLTWKPNIMTFTNRDSFL